LEDRHLYSSCSPPSQPPSIAPSALNFEMAEVKVTKTSTTVTTHADVMKVNYVYYVGQLLEFATPRRVVQSLMLLVLTTCLAVAAGKLIIGALLSMLMYILVDSLSNRRPMRDTIFTSVLAIVFLGVAVAINTYTIDARQQEGVWHFVLRVIERQVGVVCGSGSGSGSGSGLFDDESHLFAATCGTDTSTMEDYLACFEDAIHAIERNVRALSVADARMCACKDSISSFGEWQQCVSSTAGVLLETFSNSYFTITHAPAPHFKCSLTE
jgi:hypothetical protein